MTQTEESMSADQLGAVLVNLVPEVEAAEDAAAKLSLARQLRDLSRLSLRSAGAPRKIPRLLDRAADLLGSSPGGGIEAAKHLRLCVATLEDSAKAGRK